MRGAGTEANVHLIMHGTLGDGKRHQLTSGPDDFTRGVTNEFTVDDEELGELLEITVGHDNTVRAHIVTNQNHSNSSPLPLSSLSLMIRVTLLPGTSITSSSSTARRTRASSSHAGSGLTLALATEPWSEGSPLEIPWARSPTTYSRSPPATSGEQEQ